MLSLEAADRISMAMLQAGPVTPTGLPTVDRANFLWGDRRGIPLGSYVLIGAASNTGKTLFGIHMLKQAARSGQKAGFISLDMKNRDALARLHQSIATEIGWQNWLPSKWRAEYVATLANALREFRRQLHKDTLVGGYEGGILLHEDRSRALAKVEARIREGADQGVTFFVVDHMQKVRVASARGDVYTSAQVVSETMDDLVDELGVTIVGLSQLNRRASSERDRRPTMFDLHGGTDMESNAFVVIMLDHSRFQMDPDRHHLLRLWAVLEKNQAGPKALEVPIMVNAAELSVTEALDDEVKDWPTKSNGR